MLHISPELRTTCTMFASRVLSQQVLVLGFINKIAIKIDKKAKKKKKMLSGNAFTETIYILSTCQL
jgi:hypothetical protein